MKLPKMILQGVKNRLMRNLIKKFTWFISIALMLLAPNCYASADDSRHEWMNTSILGLGGLFASCLERPEFSGIVNSQRVLSMNNADQWVTTGIHVQKDKLLKFEWDTRGVMPNPGKYLVLYRIDPRFNIPQLFIQTYDYNEKKYKSDFHSYLSGALLRYQIRPEIEFATRINDFTNYFSFINRDKISFSKGDVINISLEESGSFFNIDAEFATEYSSTGIFEPELIYTTSPINDNRLMHISSLRWCTDLAIPATSCPLGGYINSLNPRSVIAGDVEEGQLSLITSSLARCADSAVGADNPICYYDNGRGMRISAAGTIIKDTYENFVTSNIGGKKFIHYLAEGNGEIDFTTDLPINNMLQGFPQLMKDWNFATFNDYRAYLASISDLYPATFLHFGRYIMNVEIGNSESVVSVSNEQAIKVHYYIQPEGSLESPSNTNSGVEVDRNYKTNASESGYLWLKVTKPDETIGGAIVVKTSNYTGSTWFSDIIYNKLIRPLRDKYNELTVQIYTKLITNPTLQGIVRTALSLYIIFFGLMFLAGATAINRH